MKANREKVEAHLMEQIEKVKDVAGVSATYLRMINLISDAELNRIKERIGKLGYDDRINVDITYYELLSLYKDSKTKKNDKAN